MKEIWKPIVGYKDRYEVSNKGRIRSLNGVGRWPKSRPKIIKQTDRGTGYLCVGLYDINGKMTLTDVHKIVCKTFHPKTYKKGLLALHKNDHRKDNKSKNLYWGTHIDNGKDKIKNGNNLVGSMVNGSKLTEKDVKIIRKQSKNGVSSPYLAKRFGVTKENIYYIIHRVTWRHI